MNFWNLLTFVFLLLGAGASSSSAVAAAQDHQKNLRRHNVVDSTNRPARQLLSSEYWDCLNSCDEWDMDCYYGCTPDRSGDNIDKDGEEGYADNDLDEIEKIGECMEACDEGDHECYDSCLPSPPPPDVVVTRSGEEHRDRQGHKHHKHHHHHKGNHNHDH